jgi:hypothetical protein
MINLYYDLAKSRFQKILSRNWVDKLELIEKRISKLEKDTPEKFLRVLIGPSFAIYPPSYVLDRALNFALRLRGAAILPIYCDSIQDVECNYYGGDWGGNERFDKNCKNCKRISESLWRKNPEDPIPLSRYLSEDDVARIDSLVDGISLEAALDFEKDGIKYGAMAKDILVNNYLVATVALIENYQFLIKVHLRNLLKVSLCYERILDQLKPDRVVSNDSYYGMWAILQQLCQARAIPFYSHWPVTRNRIAFAFNDAAMNLNFTKPWPKFAALALTESDNALIDKWLAGERGLVIDSTQLSGHEIDDPVLQSISKQKPTLVLAANVIWDLAALNKQIVFEDMVDWILQTIEWFRDNREFQLIIRPHPAETSPQIPKTRETVESAIVLHRIELPENVFLLKSDASVTLSDIVNRFDTRGVVVHTTTVGFEYPARGIPAVTTARSPYRGFGFTVDPQSRQEYFSAIESLLTKNRSMVPDSSRELARKFIKFYQFHYYADIGLFTGNPPEIADNFIDVLQSKEGPFAHVIDSIMAGSTINGQNRWIPES